MSKAVGRQKLALLLGVAGLGLPTVAAAQTGAAADAAAPAEELVVVGSRIQGSKVTGALPVTVLSGDRIEATGSVNGDDLFRSIPQAGDVNFQESRTTGNLNDARGDNASINLRSVGTGNTLVLLNGRRMNVTPGTQTENFVPVQTVNTNSIPLGGTRQVEILRDGAAAIYGADAVAGVVNITLDDRFEGLRLDGRYGFASGTDEYTVSFKGGFKTKAGGRLVLFGSYTHRTPLFASERDFSASEDHRAGLVGTPWEGDTSFDNRSTSSPWGSFTTIPVTTVRQGTSTLTTSGVFNIQPTANSAAGCSSTVINGNLCIRSGTITGATSRVLRYDENPDRTSRGGLNRMNLFATFSQDLGAVEFFSELGYYRAELTGQREQSAPISSAPISVPASNYWNPFGPTTFNGVANPNRLANLTGVPTTGLPLRITTYRPVDTGPRTFKVTDDSVRALAGLRGEFGGFKWDSAVSYSWARTKDETRNAVSNTLFQRALALSTPDAYNPFNGGNQGAFSLGDTTPSNAATIQSFLVNVARISETSLLTGDFRVNNRSLFTLPGGDVGMAAGVEFRRETYKDDRDARLDGSITYTDSVTGIRYGTDVMGASPAPDVSAGRNVYSAYVELAVPIISEEMNVPLVRNLNLQLASRDEYYSDFGNVLRSKVAGLWEVMRGISLRGAWSQSFRAPNLAQFYSEGVQVANTRTDWAACRLNNTTCTGISTLEVRAGNQRLQPEKSENLSAGLVLQPIRAITFTVDYWRLRSRGVIGLQGAQNQILYDLLLRQQGKSNPNVVRVDPIAGQVVGDLQFVQDDYFNLGPRTVSGYDFMLNLDVPRTALGDFSVDLAASRLNKLFQSPSDIQSLLLAANAAGQLGSGIIIPLAGDQVKLNGNPRWRMSANITWRAGPWTANVLVNRVGPVFDTGTLVINGQNWEVGGFTTVNGFIQYRTGSNAGALADMRFRVGARNLFDKAPPLASNNFGFLGALHDPIGRFIYVQASKDF
ncbi:MAG: hypothetical protein RIS17_770 [Pseudomonadota bacterium]